MTGEALKDFISTTFPEVTFPEITSPFLNIECAPADLLALANQLKTNEQLKMDYLFDLTALDWPENLEVVYHIKSTELQHEIVLRVKTADREKAEVPTVYEIWATAELQEREAFDLFGIQFTNHPDLRRIFLEDDWEGFPMRKDYVDEVNIVSL